MRSRRGYWTASSLAIVGFVGGMLWMGLGVMSIPGTIAQEVAAFPRVPVPGEATLHLDAREYVLYDEAARDGVSPTRSITITEERTGTPVRITSRRGTESYAARRQGTSRGTVVPPRAGSYIVRTTSHTGASGGTVAFGHSFGGLFGARTILPMIVGLLLVMAGAGVAILTFLVRRLGRSRWTSIDGDAVVPLITVRELTGVRDVSRDAAARRVTLPSTKPMSYLYAHTQHIYAYSADEVLERDHRPPIVLLRSFAGDVGRWRTDSIESAIVDGLWAWGPVIATARPVRGVGRLGEATEEYRDGQRYLVWKTKRGEAYMGPVAPPLGAARARIPSEQWQESVVEWMSEARLIVMTMGSTPGLVWEMAQVHRLDLLDRLMLVFTPVGGNGLPGVTLGPDLVGRLDTSSTRILIPRSGGRAAAVVSQTATPRAYQVAAEAAAELLLGRPTSSAPRIRYRPSAGFKRLLGG